VLKFAIHVLGPSRASSLVTSVIRPSARSSITTGHFILQSACFLGMGMFVIYSYHLIMLETYNTQKMAQILAQIPWRQNLKECTLFWVLLQVY
jgi:hypothetical protein